MENNHRVRSLVQSSFVTVCILVAFLFISHNKIAISILTLVLVSLDLNEYFFKYKAERWKYAIMGVMGLLLLGNLSYCFYEHYRVPFDGDLANEVVPEPYFKTVMHDPLGLGVVIHHKYYGNPNRFVQQWSISGYFKLVPFFFQYFTDAIHSAYLACALAKILMQVSFIYLLGVIISGQYKVFNFNFLLSSVIVAPLIQVCGFVYVMGLIDPSTTYAFAYGYSTVLDCLFFLPFFMATFYGKKLEFSYPKIILWLLLGYINAFNGPLSGPCVLILVSFMFLHEWWKGFQQNKVLPFVKRMFIFLSIMPRSTLFIMLFAYLLSLYSLYVGGHNDANMVVSLAERYRMELVGIHKVIIQKGPQFLLAMIAINVIIISRIKNDVRARKIINLFLWTVLFCVAYTLLLPLGGSRVYRPEIFRRDTIVPLTFGLIALFGISTFYLLKQRDVASIYKKIYYGLVLGILLFFVNANNMNRFDNSCEIEGLKQIAASKEKIVPLTQDCTILSWDNIRDYRESKINAELLRIWGITNEEKYYYSK